MSDENFVLSVEKISKSFPGVKALDEVSLNVKPGTVHALMGENGAGKSTFMKCIFGIYSPDSGKVFFNGKEVLFKNSKQAMEAGIAMVQQELQPIYYRSVMENVWLGRFPTVGFGPFRLINTKKMHKDTLELFRRLSLDINVKDWVINLSASQIQSMSIAMAVSYDAKVIFMDEPTSSLTSNEVDKLFQIIDQLKKEGRAIVYVSHKMDEILKIADEVSIMRDGKYIGAWPAKELTTELIINRMVGREMTNIFPPTEHQVHDDVSFEVKNICSPRPNSFQNISFTVRKGEIFGLGGLVGAQRSELMEALFGIRKIKSGSVYINGKETFVKSPLIAKKHGLALLTEERRKTGIFPILSVRDNTVIASINKYRNKCGLLVNNRMTKVALEAIQSMRVKTPSHKTFIKSLSGGNQQKVLLGRWLLTNPDVLILDEPTRGIDVGAKYEIYNLMLDLVKQGKSIIMISSEMPELMGMADRIAIMCAGRITGILNGKEATQEKIMDLATRFSPSVEAV